MRHNRFIAFLVLFLAMMIVYSLGGYWAGISHSTRTAVKSIIPALLLCLTYASFRIQPLRRWRTAAIAFLAGSSGFLASWLFSDRLLSLVHVEADTVGAIALTKLFEATLIVLPALVIARAGGITVSDLYIRRGKLRWWLPLGLGTFLLFGVFFLFQTSSLGITMPELTSLLPWTLVFVFSNAFMEELHFRGLLLRPFEGLIGKHWAIVCITISFTIVHAPVEYTPDRDQFLAVVFMLALAWGYLIQRTEALWGSVLFHAGADLLVIIGIFEAYGAL